MKTLVTSGSTMNDENDYGDKSIGEHIMNVMDATVDEEGNITCLICGLPNECCQCGIPSSTFEDDES